jgi:hypothetical protein
VGFLEQLWLGFTRATRSKQEEALSWKFPEPVPIAQDFLMLIEFTIENLNRCSVFNWEARWQEEHHLLLS